MRRRLQIDIRLAAAGVLAAAVALTILLATQPEARHEVAATSASVAPGVPISEIAVAHRSVVDPSGFILLSELDAYADHSLAIALPAGVPILTAALVSPTSARTPDLIGLDLEAEAAVHGRIGAGDRVDVYTRTDDAVLVAEALVVVEATIDQGALGSGRVGVVLAVDRSVAPDVIAAGESVFLVRKGS